MNRTGLVRAGAALGAALLMLVGLASPAGAHTELERSEPADGGTVAVGPTTITLWLTEPINPEASNFELRALDGSRAALTLEITQDDGGAVVVLDTSPLWKTTFVLEWSALATTDGHLTTGAVVFGVGGPPVAPSSAGGERLPPPAPLLLRWAELALLIVLVGALTVGALVLAPLGPVGRRALGRARAVAAVASVAALAVGAGTAFQRVPRYGRSVADWLWAIESTLVETSVGRWWLVRELALVAVAVVLIQFWRRQVTPPLPRLVPVAVAIMVGAEAWAGHAGALPRQGLVAAAMTAGHLAAAGVWAGGLLTLALALGWEVRAPGLSRRQRRHRLVALAPAWTRFSPVAALSALVLVATGTYSSGRHVPGLGVGGDTLYGDALTFKVGATVVALGAAAASSTAIRSPVGAWVTDRVNQAVTWRPRLAPRPPSPAVGVELVVLLAAVGGAALITSVVTPREVELVEAAQSAPRSANVDGLFVTFEALPAGDDQDRIVVQAVSLQRPEPAPISALTLDLLSPRGQAQELVLDPVDADRWAGERETLAPGDWQATVLVHRDPLEPSRAEFTWTVDEPIPTTARGPERVATVVAVLGLVAAAFLARRHRFRSAPPGPPIGAQDPQSLEGEAGPRPAPIDVPTPPPSRSEPVPVEALR